MDTAITKYETTLTDNDYIVTLTDTGSWLHAPGSDFLFAFLDSTWDKDTTAAVRGAFVKALGMSTTIKDAVKNTSGQTVVDGLYLQDEASMTKAMNSIKGMGQTSADKNRLSGSATAVDINGEFFTAILAGLSGDIAPMSTYLTQKMGDLQGQLRDTKVDHNFGTVIGMISVMPVLLVPVTSFVYAFSSAQTSEWLVKVNCGSVEHYSYDYQFTVVNYNYVEDEG